MERTLEEKMEEVRRINKSCKRITPADRVVQEKKTKAEKRASRERRIRTQERRPTSYSLWREQSWEYSIPVYQKTKEGVDKSVIVEKHIAGYILRPVGKKIALDEDLQSVVRVRLFVEEEGWFQLNENSNYSSIEGPRLMHRIRVLQESGRKIARYYKNVDGRWKNTHNDQPLT